MGLEFEGPGLCMSPGNIICPGGGYGGNGGNFSTRSYVYSTWDPWPYLYYTGGGGGYGSRGGNSYILGATGGGGGYGSNGGDGTNRGCGGGGGYGPYGYGHGGQGNSGGSSGTQDEGKIGICIIKYTTKDLIY